MTLRVNNKLKRKKIKQAKNAEMFKRPIQPEPQKQPENLITTPKIEVKTIEKTAKTNKPKQKTKPKAKGIY